jgi:hypothetical protein
MNNIDTLIFDDIPESHWLILCFLGMAPNEEEKLYHWAKWKNLYGLVDPILKHFSCSKLQSFQSIVVSEKALPNGFRKIQTKKAATGGIRKWSFDANKDISTKYADSANQRIIFRGSDIWAADHANPAKGWDFYLTYKNCDQLEDSAYNQTINLFLSGALIKRLDNVIFLELVRGLVELSCCMRLGKTSRRWSYIDKHFSENGASADFLIDRDYSGQYNSLELADNPFAKWDLLI